MSLSASTLNMKFMQRAAARNAQTQAQAGVCTPSRPSASGSGSTSTPAANGTSIPMSTGQGTPGSATPMSRVDSDVPPLVGLAAEQEAKARWVLPGRQRLAESNDAGPSGSGSRVTFEPSYLPFLLGESSNEAGPSRNRTTGGGGRMAFGGFGEVPKDDMEDGEEGEDGVAEASKTSRKGKERQERGHTKSGMSTNEGSASGRPGQGDRRDSKAKLPPRRVHTTAQGFVRPSNYTPDLPASSGAASASTRDPVAGILVDTKPSLPSASGQKHKRKPPGTLETSRATASSFFKPASPKGKKRTKSSSSSVGTPVKAEFGAATGVKRVKLDISSDPAVEPSGSGGGNADLDARERELKAQKKRDKKMKRKMKQEEMADA